MYKVIIADDESIMRKALLKLVDWDALDCKVIFAAEDGQAVIDYFDTEKPDIIISDIRMPRVDGLKLAAYLAQNEPQIKMILLTAYADFTYAQQAILYNVSEYVVKRGASDQIVAAIKRCKKQLAATQMQKVDVTDSLEQLYKNAVEGNAQKDITASIPDAERYLLVQYLPYDSVSSETKRAETLHRAASFLSDALGTYVIAQFPVDSIYQYFILRQLPSELLEGYCHKALDSFRYVTGTSFYAGISALCATTEGLADAALQAREALGYSFYDSTRAIHYYSAAHRFSQDGAVFFSAQNARFTSTLQLGATTSSLELLDTIFEFQKTNNISPELVRREAEQLIDLCKSGVRSAGAYWSDALPCSEAQLSASLKYCGQFQLYYQLLSDVVERSCQLIAKAIEHHSDIVLLARSYIHANYQQNISLNDIAAAVNANPSYLSRTFKARTGTSIVDTITSFRMEKAKMLLSAGHLRIQDIAMQVGIENTTYFSQVFKKYTGMSPKDYQKSAYQGPAQ